MTEFFDIQSSFAGGEVAPDIRARIDLQKYKISVKTMRNMLPSPHGSVSNRPGTKFIGSTKYSDRKSRLIPFVFSNDQAYLLEFGDLYVRFYKNDALILNSIDQSELPFFQVNATYQLNDYVLIINGDGTFGIYRSLVYANTAHTPNVSPTQWSHIGDASLWSPATTYSINQYVYEIRPSDGKHKIFKSQVNSNLDNDPLTVPSGGTWWIAAHSPEYEWDPTNNYGSGQMVVYYDGLGNQVIYLSIQNNNLNHSIFDGAWWQAWFGPTAWNSGVTYYLGNLVTVISGGLYKVYVSAADNNTNHDPLGPTNPWIEISQAQPFELVTPYGQNDLAALKFTQSADTIFFAHQSYAPQTLKRFSDANWTLAPFAYVNGPFMLANADPTKVAFVGKSGSQYTLQMPSSFTLDPKHVGALFKLEYFIPSYLDEEVFTVTRTAGAHRCGGTWRLITTGTWDGTLYVERSDDGGTNWEPIQSYTSHGDTNVNTFGTETVGSADDPDADNFLIRLRFVGRGAVGTCNANLSRDAFKHIGIVQVTQFVNSTQARVAIEREVITVSDVNSWDGIGNEYLVKLWAEGSWSNFRGWPGTVSFFQDRLVFAGTPTEPQTDWMSKVSDYVDFGTSTPLVDDDALSLNLTGRQMNPIKALFPFLNSCLNFGSGAEWDVGSTDGGAITPSTAYVKLQGLRGIGDVDPVAIGHRIIFIEPRGSAVRDMVYQYFTNIYESENISIFADHLFKGYTIVAAAYQQEPDSQLWFVRSDGTLLCLTYLREQEVLAWSRHDTNGTFESVCVLPSSTDDVVWFIVNRNGNRYVEKLTTRVTSTDPADQYFVDAGVSYSGAAVTSVSGLDHLNGMTVAINAEGFVLAQQTVVNGSVTLDKARSKVQVGVPYNADLELLNPEVPMRDGTSQGRRFQVTRVVFRFLNTVGGMLGPNANTLVQPFNHRDNSLSASTPTPLFTGFDQEAMPQDDDQVGHVFYRQADPMPVTIIGITSHISQNEDPILSGIDP